MAVAACPKCGAVRDPSLMWCRSCGDRSGGVPPSVAGRLPQPRSVPAIPSTVHSRGEQAGLLWRSIVQGFGFAAGFTLFIVIFWLLVFVLLGGLIHFATPVTSGPGGGIPLP